ncbi:hypothetical protein OIV83_006457 [Microbotryomycetes sp. JL201]|nr:hypothetical protein OIV83_006457 [Microbotryomycetes sp. JL201]
MLAPATAATMFDTFAGKESRCCLLPLNARKTIDFGHDGVAASLSLAGRFLSVHGPHASHGMMVVVPYEQFPQDKFYEPKFVREYRARPLVLLDKQTSGFGLSLRDGSDARILQCTSSEYVHHKTPRLEFKSCDGAITATALYNVVDSSVVQSVLIRNADSQQRAVDVTLDGLVSLNRASYAQLTEGGPLPMPAASSVAAVYKDGLTIDNCHLPAKLDISLAINELPVKLATKSGWTSDKIACLDNATQLILQPGESAVVQLALTLSTNGSDARPSPRSLSLAVRDRMCAQTGLDVPKLANLVAKDQATEAGHVLAYAVARNVQYLLDCCTIPMGPERGVCIITDHQCLPLGWNRDNYWQLNLLRSLEPVLHSLVHSDVVDEWRARICNVRREHLRWVMFTAERPLGYWGRSYTTVGQSKDPIFQLDQQCYPLLELAEYATEYAQDAQGQDLVKRALESGVVDEVLDTIMAHRWQPVDDAQARDFESKDALWLFKTEETPGDDAVAFPYHFSSHVLLWRALDQLARFPESLRGLLRNDVRAWADHVRRATLEHFVQPNPKTGQLMFAYLTSTRGEFEFYHDGNDLPTALIPEWGFCDGDASVHEVWRSTMSWAFSSFNENGYFNDGQFAGLGSVHTRDPWPLGDAQQLVFAARERNGDQILNVKTKLARVVQWDGLWSEAVDRHTGQVTSKHWFSWPGSFIGSVLLSRCGVE